MLFKAFYPNLHSDSGHISAVSLSKVNWHELQEKKPVVVIKKLTPKVSFVLSVLFLLSGGHIWLIIKCDRQFKNKLLYFY